MISRPSEQNPPYPHRSAPAIAVFLLSGLACLFVIPFLIPVKPALSDSYLYGFSNRAALILFIVFAIVFAWWTRGFGLHSPSSQPSSTTPRSSSKALVVCLAVTAFLTVAMALAMRSFGVINEAIYITDRLRQLMAGKSLYTGFEFIYGPAMLYLPAAISHLFNIHLLDAYYISWILSWIVGVAMIWWTIRYAAPNSPRATTIFLCLFASFITSVITYGINYTPLRFIAAPFLATLVWRSMQAAWRPAVVSTAALAAGAWLLFYSPETGLAFLAGTLLFLIARYPISPRLALTEALLVFLPGAALLLLAGFNIHLFDTMRAIASGGYNFPLLPSIGSLLILFHWLAAACILASALLARKRFAIVEYLILIGFCGLPGALGRCDPSHMLSSTLAAIIGVWIVLSFRSYGGRIMWTTFVLGSLALPIGLYQSNNFAMMPVKFALLAPGDPQPALRRFATSALQHILGPRRTAAELAKWDTKFPKVNPAWNTPPNATLLAPLGYSSNLRISQPMPPISNGYFFGLTDIMQAAQVQRKIDELRDAPATLLLFPQDHACPAAATPSTPAELAAEDRETRRQLLLNLQPFYLPKVRNRDNSTGSVCDYIRDNYQRSTYVAPFVNASIWQRKTR